MKHLTTYKLFESTNTEEIKSNCRDIFQELIDIGFECEIDFIQNDKYSSVYKRFDFNHSATIKGYSSICKITLICPMDRVYPISNRKKYEIMEYINRLDDYMENTEGFNLIDKDKTLRSFRSNQNKYSVWYLYERKDK